MADSRANVAASVRQRLLNLARGQGRPFELLLVRYALERLLFRLSVSAHRGDYVLKGGMLVAQWLDHGNRETRDADFLGFGDDDPGKVRAVFAGIMAIACEDGLVFDVEGLAASIIREEMEYGGVRLRTTAGLAGARIPVTLDIGFGDALADAGHHIEYNSLLGMERPRVRSYPPETVIAEKFQALVTLGLANGRMKDFYDLWAVPRAIAIAGDVLDAAICATFARRGTPVPTERPDGLSAAMARDPAARRRWQAYAASLAIPAPAFEGVLDDIWAYLAPTCDRLNTDCK